MNYVLPVILSYLLGSVVFSYVMGKLKGIDIRKHGSGNAGATNTLRTLGLIPAIIVLALDISKGILGVWIGKWFATGDDIWLPILCGLSVIIGHNWPIFLRFKGGKGVATTIGMVATLCFLPALFAGIIAIASIFITRYVSLGSLIFTALLPIFLWLMDWPSEIIIGSIIIFLFVHIRHISNIKKLLKGQENKIGAKKSIQ